MENAKYYDSLVRLRSINSAYKELREMDPDSSISKAFLKELVATQQIKSYCRGNKKMVNLLDVENYFLKGGRK